MPAIDIRNQMIVAVLDSPGLPDPIGQSIGTNVNNGIGWADFIDAVYPITLLVNVGLLPVGGTVDVTLQEAAEDPANLGNPLTPSALPSPNWTNVDGGTIPTITSLSTQPTMLLVIRLTKRFVRALVTIGGPAGINDVDIIAFAQKRNVAESGGFSTSPVI